MGTAEGSETLMSNKINIPRSRPPGRLGAGLLQRVIEIDLGRGTSPASPIGPTISPAAPGTGKLFVADALTEVTGVAHLVFGQGLVVSSPFAGTANVDHQDYLHFAFTSMNIAGSNETERVRRRINISQWEEGMLTCCGSSDANGFDLVAEFYDEGLAAWVGLGPVLAFPDSIAVDNPDGFQEGPWVALHADAIDQGWSIIRVDCTGDSAADDVYSLELILRRGFL